MHINNWWKKAVFYQIYPRSFADSNGDGIGDIPGIIQRLDYLRDLGIDAIWLSPHYPSPLWDCGYDISDYTGVAPEYGSLEDFKGLLDEIHSRDMRLILDLVLNHTSNQHPWFIESSSSLDNPKRDWYIWRDGKKDGPPNNWYSTFGDSAWEFDPRTEQYYYHFFFKQQPDLNWRNPEVKQAMFDIVRFWLGLGVDGYRLDAIGTIFEDPDLVDQQAVISQPELYRLSRLATSESERAAVEVHFEQMFKHQHDLPEVHDLLKELRTVVNEYGDRVLVGETDEVSYCGNGGDELHMVFNFPLMKTNQITPHWVRQNQTERLSALPAPSWPCNTLGNHDTSRVISRYGDGIHDGMIARYCLALMLTLKGTPFLYNGEEIGMTDLSLDSIHHFRDFLGIWAYETEREVFGSSPESSLAYASRMTRDKCRTPFQWENTKNAGFCPEPVEPWLPVNPNYAEGVNWGDQVRDPDSLFHFYRELLRVRRINPALIFGDYLPVHTDAVGYLAFLRRVVPDGQICLVIINMSDQAYDLTFDLGVSQAKLIFSSRLRPAKPEDLVDLYLAPFETFIGEIKTNNGR